LRAWFSGRTSPCQGEGRGFESHRPLCKSPWRRGQVVRQGSAKPSSRVRIPSTPQNGLGLRSVFLFDWRRSHGGYSSQPSPPASDDRLCLFRLAANCHDLAQRIMSAPRPQAGLVALDYAQEAPFSGLQHASAREWRFAILQNLPIEADPSLSQQAFRRTLA
jgi:hypothetical protein